MRRLPSFATETVTLLRDSPGGNDPYGDPNTSTTARTDVAGCIVTPNTSVEPTARGRAGVVTGWTVYAPTGTDARFTDRVEVRGVVCRIDGEVGDWRTSSNRLAVVVINAVRAEG